MRLRMAALAAVVALTCGACSKGTPAPVGTPGAAGIGDSVHPGLGNGGYTVLHNQIEISIDPKSGSFRGTAKMRARATQNLSSFNLDSSGGRIFDVSVDHQPARKSRKNGELTIVPETAIERGRIFSATTAFSGNAQLASRIRDAQIGNAGLIRHRATLYTNSQPGGAHKFVPIADHPRQKAPTTISITTDAALYSVANGVLKTTKSRGGAVTRTFETSQPIAPQLIQISAGSLREITARSKLGTRLRSVVSTNKNGVRNAAWLRKNLYSVVDYFEARFGPSPQHPLGVLALRLDPRHRPLETQGLTLMSADRLAGPNIGRGGASVTLAHELAHEWFGNSVSVKDWSDLWLSEGHATFYEDLWAASGSERSLERLMRKRAKIARSYFQKYGPVAKPKIHTGGPHAEDPFGPVVYGGGAAVLYGLRQRVGHSMFEKIERAWLKRFGGKSAGTSDYIALASEVSGRSIGPMLRRWLYSRNMPKIPASPAQQ